LGRGWGGVRSGDHAGPAAAACLISPHERAQHERHSWGSQFPPCSTMQQHRKNQHAPPPPTPTHTLQTPALQDIPRLERQARLLEAQALHSKGECTGRQSVVAPCPGMRTMPTPSAMPLLCLYLTCSQHAATAFSCGLQLHALLVPLALQAAAAPSHPPELQQHAACRMQQHPPL